MVLFIFSFSDVDDDRRALISVERNIANIERSLSASTANGGGGGNGETLLAASSVADGAVVRNHHSDAARGLGKLFVGGRSSSMGRDLRITETITFKFEEV